MDLSDRGDLVWLSGLIRDLRRAMPRSTPLLVGATARDLQLHHGHGIPIARATTDVDVAFAMADWEEFDALRAALLDSHAFVPTRSDHRLLHQHRVPVDLIPFGEIEAPVFDVDVEDALEPLHPAHGRGTRRMGLAGGLMGRVGDDVMAVFAVRGEHAVVSGEMGAGARHEGGEAGDAKSAGLPSCTAGGCPEGVRHADVPHEFDWVEHDMSGSVTEGVLESIHDLPAVIDREAFVRECRAGDVAAKALERVPLMGSAARVAMQRKPRELSDALRERVGCDGAQGQGLAPGMGADCDAIVDDGAEELLETVGGFEVEGGGLVVTDQQSLHFEGAGDADGDGAQQTLELILGRGAATAKAGPFIVERVHAVDEEHVQVDVERQPR